MTKTRLGLGVTILGLAVGCSAPAPTGPTLDARVSPTAATAVAAPLTGDNPAAQCQAITGSQYRGVCQAAAALQCSSPESGNAEQCDRLRVYISRDVAECARILWLCPDGFSAFRDETGCGCKVATP